MNSYFTKTPNWVRKIYPKQTWSLPNSKKEIYLTFDDGPTPGITEWVLDTLQKYQAKATFFCIGKNIEKNPKIFDKIIKSGHVVGNHTYNHENGWKTKNDDYTNSILKTEKLIKNPELLPVHSSAKADRTPNSKLLFRPPYGKIKKSQTKLLIKNNYKIIMWSILSWDFDTTITTETCLNNVVENTKSGDIIVFHDSVKAFKNLKSVLPKVLEYFSGKGYVFKEIK